MGGFSSDVLVRSIKAYLRPNLINFDWVNFSMRRSVKVMFLLTLSVFTELAFTNAIWHIVTKLLVYAGRKKLFSLLTKCKQMDMQQNNQATGNHCNIDICYYLFFSTLTQTYRVRILLHKTFTGEKLWLFLGKQKCKNTCTLLSKVPTWAHCIKLLPEKNSGYFNRSFFPMVKSMVKLCLPEFSDLYPSFFSG